VEAAVNTRYGSPDVVEVREVPKPAPKADEVLIKVHATTVSRSDCGMLRAKPFFMRLATGLLRPKLNILGMDFAGVIESVGENVTAFSPGEQVFGLSPDKFGAHAEYLCLPESGAIATIPEGISFNEAVVCEGAWYANVNLRAFGLKSGDKILIYGASGAIGTAAVQLAKSYGAEVTAVVATRHLELARSLGADNVVDYTKSDFTQTGERFDFVFDAVGKTTFFLCRKLLKPRGVFAATDLGPWWQNLLLATWYSIIRGNRVIFPMPKRSREFVDFLKTRMQSGKFHAVIDRAYPLDNIKEAYRYVERAKKTGIVIIKVLTASENDEVVD